MKTNTPCPSCGGGMGISALRCARCDVTLSGPFSTANEFADLDDDQLQFLRVFVSCEGRIRDMEAALGVSYPTVKNRITGLKKALGMNGNSGRESKVNRPSEGGSSSASHATSESAATSANAAQAVASEPQSTSATRDAAAEMEGADGESLTSSEILDRLDRGEIDFETARDQLARRQ